MDDIIGRLWDRFPERRSRPYFYNQNPSPNPYYNQPQPVFQSVPRTKPRTFSVPVSDYHNPGFPKHEHYSSTSKPKNVVSVPVNFVNSDAGKAPSMDESTAAVKVQKVFRGFLVRKLAPLKNLKIIAKVKAEGEEIRKRISDEKVVNLVRRDEKERLKITEWIMSLLLKLDAIQGVNSFVIESRKAVNRELVHLQETVDAIISGKPMEEEMHKGDTVSFHTEDMPDILDKNEETAALECWHVNSGVEIKEEDQLDNSKEIEDVNDAELRDSKLSETRAEECLPTQMQDLQLEGSNETEEFCASKGTDNDVELEKVRHNFSGSENGLVADMLETETVQGDENIKGEDKNTEDEVVDATVPGTGDTLLSTREEAIEDIGMVREENKRLKTMVADLLKKSEKQSEMIDNLSSRIVQLEEQVSNKKKIAEQRKKARALTDVAFRLCAGDESENGTTTLTDERMPQPQERRRRRKMKRHLNGLREDWS